MTQLESGRTLLRESALALVAGSGYNGLSVVATSLAGNSDLLEAFTGSAIDPLVWISRAGVALAIAALLPAFVLHSFCGRRALAWALLAALLPMIEPLYYHLQAGFGFEPSAIIIGLTYLLLPLGWVLLFRLLAYGQQPHCPSP